MENNKLINNDKLDNYNNKKKNSFMQYFMFFRIFDIILISLQNKKTYDNTLSPFFFCKE